MQHSEADQVAMQDVMRLELFTICTLFLPKIFSLAFSVSADTIHPITNE